MGAFSLGRKSLTHHLQLNRELEAVLRETKQVHTHLQSSHFKLQYLKEKAFNQVNKKKDLPRKTTGGVYLAQMQPFPLRYQDRSDKKIPEIGVYREYTWSLLGPYLVSMTGIHFNVGKHKHLDSFTTYRRRLVKSPSFKP